MNHKGRKDREDKTAGILFFEVFAVQLALPNPGSLQSQRLPLFASRRP
jgi:hypothetical protein